MGELRIVAGGIQLSGQAMVLDALLASTIRSRKGQHISIESSRNFTVNARDEGGRVVNRIFLGNDQLECLAREFKVTDARGTVLFSASKQEVVVGAKVLRVTGEGGAIFDGTVQTPIVRADSGHELRLESPTRSLKVRAPLGVLIESRAGDISASCLTDLKLQSLAGAQFCLNSLSLRRHPVPPTTTLVSRTLFYLPPRLALPGLYPTSHRDSRCRDSILPPTTTHVAGTISPTFFLALPTRVRTQRRRCRDINQLPPKPQEGITWSVSFSGTTSLFCVRLDSANVFLPGLKTAPPPLPGAPPPAVPRRPNSPRHEIYQLCVCSNGKLFLASPEGVCAADDDSVVCR
uniref:Zeta-sarcoglycan n=1 Tax=Timema monikensis TaxID=170555 RepID=A0A7R9HIM1_9NEOP|nr:unnamed protein product [Timema monikensis]